MSTESGDPALCLCCFLLVLVSPGCFMLDLLSQMSCLP